MSNEYLDRLQKELEDAGVEPKVKTTVEENSAKFREAMNERTIDEMEKITGTKYSDEQKAVLSTTGNACILASAGSGKTTVSTHLIAKRIKTGEIRDVSKLVYTTYSKAGQLEMKLRLDKLLRQLGINKDVEVRTLHSFFLQVLRTFGVNAAIIKPYKRTQFVREACRDAKLVGLKEDEILVIDNLISYQINNLLDNEYAVKSRANTIEGLDARLYGMIVDNYNDKKIKNNVIDYDDMQQYLYKWLIIDAASEDDATRSLAENVRNYCQAMWTDFYIDEAQDVSKIQFEIIRAIVTEPGDRNRLKANLVFIGDDDQCLVEGTKVRTTKGFKNIEDIRVGDEVISAVGNKRVAPRKVEKVAEREVNELIFTVHTRGGRVVKGTYNHTFFVRRSVMVENSVLLSNKYFYTWLFETDDGLYYLYECNGMFNDVKLSQVKKAWIIDTVENEKDAKCEITFYSCRFGIPILGMHVANGRRAYIDYRDNAMKEIQSRLNIENSIKELCNTYGIMYNYPVYEKSTGNFVETTLFGKNGSTETRVQLNSGWRERNTNQASKDEDGTAHCVSHVTDSIEYHEHLKKEAIVKCGLFNIDLNVIQKAALTQFEFNFMPMGNLAPGMKIPVCDEDTENVYEDEIVSVDMEPYNGKVYDLSVPRSVNFIANGIVVHNCIYTWRGSDPNIILTVAPTFNMKTNTLTTNYRCLSEIVDYAITGIKCNGNRYDKSMVASKQGGSVKIAICDKNDLCLMSIMAMQHIKYLLKNGERPNNIAVLCRNNFHLAILNNMLFREGIYCNATDDMKLTKCNMYNDIKSIIKMIEHPFDCDNTRHILWKLCTYLTAANAKAVSDFQVSTGLSIKDAIGYIVKNYIDKEIDFDLPISIPTQAKKAMEYRINSFHYESRSSFKLLYTALCSDDKGETMRALLVQYLSVSKFLYKTPDKSRSVSGLVRYINNLLMKDGYDKTREFLKLTEQLESGTMVIPGEKITLTTVHSAKGREWKNVILFAVDNVSFPDLDSIHKMLEHKYDIHEIFEYINEERRLFYVGNTRAKENLLTITSRVPSVFILEALGIFGNDGNSANATVLKNSQDVTNVWFDGTGVREQYHAMVLDKNSKYYYDAEEIKRVIE